MRQFSLLPSNHFAQPVASYNYAINYLGLQPIQRKFIELLGLVACEVMYSVYRRPIREHVGLYRLLADDDTCAAIMN